MKTRIRQRQNAGFTLIELLIASTVALVAFAAALGAGISLQKVNTDRQDLLTTQSSLHMAEEILIRELEKAGAGFSKVAVMAYNQQNTGLHRARLALSITDVEKENTDCQSKTCSLLTILSGEVERSLQLEAIAGNELTVTGSSAVIAHWIQEGHHVSAFLLVDPRSNAQCLMEDVKANAFSYLTSTPNLLNVSLTNLTKTTPPAQTCDLSNFGPGNAFIMPLRETLFMTDGFQINANWRFIQPGTIEDRLKYIPNRHDVNYSAEGNLQWLTISREMESLGVHYTIFNNANPMEARWRVHASNTEKEESNAVLYAPTSIRDQGSINKIIQEKQLLPSPDPIDSELIAFFDNNNTEKFVIPLLRRISQIQVDFLARKECKESDPEKRCTSATKDRDDEGYQIRNESMRINPNNLALISMNEYIR